MERVEQSPANPNLQPANAEPVIVQSPVRVDLAGGWTDTPPYCLLNGGAVVNAAVDLGGGPPVQVTARKIDTSNLIIRSIDGGSEELVTSFGRLGDFARPGSDFSLARAALSLAGFLPRFNAACRCLTLREQLDEIGGGIEISMKASVPQGSGLGTSSILAAALLAALSTLCGLGWDRACSSLAPRPLPPRTSTPSAPLG